MHSRNRSREGHSSFAVSCLYRFKHGSNWSGKSPSQWEWIGYNEIQNSPKKKRLVNYKKRGETLGIEDYDRLKETHLAWVEKLLLSDKNKHEMKWSQSVAVGSKAFVEKTKKELEYKARGRRVIWQ